jgi:excisionase family DNA binding protein
LSIVKHLRDRDTALTSAELCKLINVHPVTLREWTRSGRIPAYRIGREWRYDPAKVADWLDEREVGIP